MPTELSRDQLHRLARLGAQSRLAELRKEEAAIRGAFPDLFRGAGGAAKGARGAATASKKRTRKRRKMSAAEKRAVSERMKKYWADRRKAR